MEEQQQATTTTIDEELLQCPVCKDIMVEPRMYTDCGHTVCTSCMKKMDRLRAENSVFHTPLYRCPCCRTETIYRWYARPINRAIMSICEKHEKYASRVEEVRSEEKNEEKEPSIPDNIDLRALATESREQIALDLYDKLLPIMYEAAAEGRRHVVITKKKTIRKIELVCDLLSTMFFETNNIFKILCTRSECQIIFSDDAFTVLREYTNNDVTEEEIEETPPPLPNTPIQLLNLDAIAETIRSSRRTLPIGIPIGRPLLARRAEHFTEAKEDEDLLGP